MTLLMWVAIFVCSLIVLIKASDYFTIAAEKIGIFFGMPSFIVGVTIIGAGTSLPELASSIVAALEGSTEIVIGNVAGSNIANILLVLGLAAIIGKRLKVSWELVNVDLPILIGSALLLVATAMDGTFSFNDGILCLTGYMIYIVYAIKSQKKHDKKIKKIPLGWQPPILLIISGAGICFAANYTIESVVKISEILNTGKEIIAVSVMAIGTSLPELVISVVAATKGKSEIAMGNVLGSNIFNSFTVMGVPAMIAPLAIPETITSFALPVMLVATLMYFFITQDKQVTRFEGSILIVFYLVFIGKTFNIL